MRAKPSVPRLTTRCLSQRVLRGFSFALTGVVLLANVPHVQASESEKTEFKWDGQYIGAMLGASYGHAQPSSSLRRDTYFLAADKTQLDPLLDESFGGADVTGSLIWGYNKQKSRWIFGVEGDLSLSDYNETHETGNIAYVTQPGSTFQFSTTIKSHATASLRPRVGYIHNDSLFFASAGPALSVFEFDFDFTETFQSRAARSSETAIKLGAALNIGLEHRFRDDWSLRAGYLFTYFPNAVDTTTELSGAEADQFKHEIDYQSHTLRIGLVKRF